MRHTHHTPFSVDHRVSRTVRVVSGGLLVAFGCARADSSGKGFGELFVAGVVGVATTVSVSAGGTYLAATGGSAGAVVVVGVLMAVSSFAGSATTSNLHKDLVLQLKIDHDTYLAGGGMTPFLQEVYRDLQSRTLAYSIQGGDPGDPSIDEQKMTSVVDRLAWLAASSNANP